VLTLVKVHTVSLVPDGRKVPYTYIHTYIYSITLPHSFQENTYTEYVFTCVILRHPIFFQAMNYEKFVAYIWVNTVNPLQSL